MLSHNLCYLALFCNIKLCNLPQNIKCNQIVYVLVLKKYVPRILNAPQAPLVCLQVFATLFYCRINNNKKYFDLNKGSLGQN